MFSEKGTLVWRLLFSVAMAVLLAASFYAFYASQERYGIGSQAQSLADDISQTCFLAFTRQGPTYNLPSNVGGTSYEFRVNTQTDTIVVETNGSLYRSSVGANLENVGPLPSPGETLYTQGLVDKVLISKNVIQPSVGDFDQENASSEPNFYSFAKENPRAATALMAAYFHMMESSSTDNLDIKEYEQRGSDTFLARATSDDGDLIVRIIGYENSQDVAHVKEVWIVGSVENYSDSFDGTDPPSVKNAVSSGWFYTPSQIVAHLRGRTWHDENGEVVSIPSAVEPLFATATTRVRTYPTYRFEFKGYLLHFGSMMWKWNENQPGFRFQSDPKLEGRA